MLVSSSAADRVPPTAVNNLRTGGGDAIDTKWWLSSSTIGESAEEADQSVVVDDDDTVMNGRFLAQGVIGNTKVWLRFPGISTCPVPGVVPLWQFGINELNCVALSGVASNYPLVPNVPFVAFRIDCLLDGYVKFYSQSGCNQADLIFQSGTGVCISFPPPDNIDNFLCCGPNCQFNLGNK